MPSSTRWRLNISANGGTYLGLAELQMMTSIGGSTVCSGGTPSVNSSYSSSYDAAKAFDANNSTYWCTAAGVTSGWIEYQFGSAQTIVEISIRAASGGYGSIAPKNFDVEYYDGANWQIALSITGQYAFADGEVRNFVIPVNIGTKILWRIYVTDNNSPSDNIIIAETELRVTASGANQATTASHANGDSWQYGGAPPGAIDASTGFFQSVNSAFPHWWSYYFAAETDIVEYTIKSHQTSGYEQYSPKDFKLQYWSGSAWVDADVRTGVTFTNDETKTFTVTAPTTATFPALSVAI